MAKDSKPDRKKAQGLLAVAEAEAIVGIPNDDTLHDIADALGDDPSRNANPIVPWSDPMIPFECGCGAIIYADSVHDCDG